MLNRRPTQIAITFIFLLAAFFAVRPAPAQSNGPTAFRVGERITYTVSFDRFSDVAYAETYVASRGALAGRDAVELRSKARTLNLVSAAFWEVDEVRTVYADPATGGPLLTKVTKNPDGLPSETTLDHIKEPTSSLDLLTLIYRIRQMGTGSVTVLEGGKTYTVAFAQTGGESVRTPAGDFNTTTISVQSEYFTEMGFREVTVNLTNDEAKIPVVIRLKTKRNELRAAAASVQMVQPEQPDAAPTPAPSPTVAPLPTPRPTRTPEPYVDNRPISAELAFQLGEALEYRVTVAGRPVGTFVMRVRERRNIDNRDTLVLAATVTNAEAGNPVMLLNDSITALVDPDSLVPRQVEIKLQSGLSSLNQTTIFNTSTGTIVYRGNNRVDAPVGTHSLLSLIYAMRSFNLRQSKTRDNPVNDTRVAVFWDSQPYVFRLRPAGEGTIEIGGEKVQAQPVSISTDNPQLDALNLRIWLSVDESRVPLRIALGPYQADLASVTNIPVK